MTPSEKAIGTHYVVAVDPTLGGGYYDPSYAQIYSTPADLENALVMGYWAHDPGADPKVPNAAARPISQGQPNITFTKHTDTHSSPTPISPMDNATGQSVTPTLTWNAVLGARSYILQVGSNNSFPLADTFIAPILLNGQLSVSFTVPGGRLQTGTSYTWSVSSTDCSGTIKLSAPFHFTTQ